ncbi:MAG: cupin domain-containing protein [Lachnospiraceae bacterium]|nr:cupin domain-containing protein [Lachnospiraceae bacterium]
MILNYNEMQEEKFPNFKGGEKEYASKMFFDGTNRIMLGRLIPGASIGVHTHETNSEVMYFLEGTGKVLMDGEYEKVEAGVAHYCPKGHTHSLINDSDADLVFFAVVPEQ